jgi:hypothetical protein
MPVGLGRTSLPIILFLARKAEGIIPISFRVCVSPATLRKASEAGPSSSNCAAAKVCRFIARQQMAYDEADKRAPAPLTAV